MNLAQLTVVGTVATDIDTHVLPDGRHRARFRVAATSRLLDARTGRSCPGAPACDRRDLRATGLCDPPSEPS